MAPTSVAPVQQALVQTLRANATLKAALKGGIHDGVAPEDTQDPWLTYRLHYAPYLPDWGSTRLKAGFDLFVYSQDQVGARNLDQLVMTTLWDAQLNVSGQSTLFCRKIMDVQDFVVNDEGRKIYVVGGLYEVQTDQDL